MTKTKKEEKKQGWLVENLKAILWAAVIALAFRSIIAEPFNIPSGSMIPNLLVGDYLFVSKHSYGYSRYSLPLGIPLIPGRIFYSEPKRGDVVVFKLPVDNSTDYIKRVIGLPGDRIQMKNGRLYINGDMVERIEKVTYWEKDYTGLPIEAKLYNEILPGGVTHDIIELSDQGIKDNTQEFLVPKDMFFMMGDNRDNSMDSRYDQTGMVPKANLVGKAQFIFYSNNGYAPFVAFWNWGKSIRTERLFTGVK